MKRTSRFVVILYGIGAVIWTVRAILDVVYQTYHDSVLLFVLSILCAVIWVFAFFAMLKRYRSNKDE